MSNLRDEQDGQDGRQESGNDREDLGFAIGAAATATAAAIALLVKYFYYLIVHQPVTNLLIIITDKLIKMKYFNC